MVLRCIILGLLFERPRTGYDLKAFFEKTINFFWSAELSQIYRELAKLEGDGYVTYEIEEQEGRPDKKIYSVTEKGQKFFENWLMNFPQRLNGGTRNEFLVRVFFSSRLPKGELIFQLKRYIRELEEELEIYRNINAKIDRELEYNKDDNEVLYRRLTVKRGIKYSEAEIEWAEECIEEIEEITK